jgi:hypothetical protein
MPGRSYPTPDATGYIAPTNQRGGTGGQPIPTTGPTGRGAENTRGGPTDRPSPLAPPLRANPLQFGNKDFGGGKAFQQKGPAWTKSLGSGGGAAAAPAEAAPTTGTQSGPGILENWFNQRAGGTDPGWEYGIGRASDAINKQYAARGGYNSSGAMQSLSDMYSNATSQRESQLDQLAAGASGEHQRRTDSMFGQGMGLANSQAGTAWNYDSAEGASMASNMAKQMDLMMQQSGLSQQTRQAQLDAIFGVGKMVAGAVGGATPAKV